MLSVSKHGAGFFSSLLEAAAAIHLTSVVEGPSFVGRVG
jgi:hypothetical protein